MKLIKYFIFASVAASQCWSATPVLTSPDLVATNTPDEITPVVILGSGVGALTSAIYLGRAQIQPVVIEGKYPGGALVQSHCIQNWPGEIEISGQELMGKIRKHAEESGAKFLHEEVVSVDFSKRPFIISTKDVYDVEKTRQLKAESVIIAMGSSPAKLGIPGENDYWSKGVYSCALCDGALYRNKVVAVVGGGDAAITEADYLSNIAKKVIIILRGKEFRAKDEAMKINSLQKQNIEVLTETVVEEIKGNDGKLSHLVLNHNQTKEELPVDALFLAIGSKPNTQMFENQLALDEKGFIIRNDKREASVPGVVVIGDIGNKFCSQAVCAAGEGAEATVHIQKHLQSYQRKNTIAATTPPPVKHEVIEVSTIKEFQKELSESYGPTVVDFYASWCGPCKVLSPRFNELAKRFSSKMKFIKVNVDTAHELAELYQIRAMPTLIVFNEKGQESERRVGTDEIFRFTADLEKRQQSPSH